MADENAQIERALAELPADGPPEPYEVHHDRIIDASVEVGQRPLRVIFTWMREAIGYSEERQHYNDQSVRITIAEYDFKAAAWKIRNGDRPSFLQGPEE